MSKFNIRFGAAARVAAAVMSVITVAFLFVPVITLYSPAVSALANNTEYTPDGTYLSGSDFQGLAEGAEIGTVTASGGTPPASAGPVYEHTVDGKLIYKVVPKRSYLRVISENGNKFLRAYRTPVGGSGTTSNDVYWDFEDTQKGVYTGDFVAEAAYRFVDYPKEMGNINLMQFINRDNGVNTFQSLMGMNGDGLVYYRSYDEATGKESNKPTGFVMTENEWYHLAVAIHRNETGWDTMDVYVNGERVAEGVILKNEINDIYQFRVAQSDGKSAASCIYDLDNVWIYRGSEPSFTVGSGMDKDKLIGELDFSDPALAVGSTVAGTVTTEKFEIEAKNDAFTVVKDTWRKLLKMDHSRGEPYVDVYANGARGSLVLDIGLILGDDWTGRAELLTPYAIAENGYVTREEFLTIDSSRRLYDRDGRLIAELGTGINRIALSLSSDRSLATVFINGEMVGRYETEYGFAYAAIDGMRAFQYKDSFDGGTAYIYYAEIYRGTQPAVLDDARQEYFSDFDGVTDAETLAPLQLIGAACLGDGNVGFYGSASAESSIRYSSAVSVDGLTVSFMARVDRTAGLELFGLGDAAIMSVGADGRLTVNTADGDKALFKMAQGKEYLFTLSFSDGKLSVYADGLPFVSSVALPDGIGDDAEHVELLSVTADGEHYAYVDSLEIYTGGECYVTALPVPVAPTVEVRDHKAVLSWSSVGGVSGYRVYRSLTADGEFEDVSGLVSDSTYTDATVAAGVEYFYKVAVEVTVSDEVFLLGLEAEPTPFEDGDPALYVKASGVSGGVKLTWQAFSGNNLGYSVYRSFQLDGEYQLIAEKLTVTEYLDGEAFPGLITYYKVCVIIERGGGEFIFGLESKPIEATAGEVVETPDEPSEGEGDTEEPTVPDDGGVDTLPSDPNGVNIPSVEAEKLFGADFEKPLDQLGGLTVVGSGFGYTEHAGGNALRLQSSEASYISVSQAYLSALSTVIDLSICIESASDTVAIIAPADANGVLFNLIEAKVEGGAVHLGVGGGESKRICSFPAGEWHRITVWINAAGDKAAVFSDGVCISPDVALTGLSTMTDIRFLAIGAGASAVASVDDISVISANVYANAYNSAVLTPSVSVTDNANTLSWRAANGALYYTVWRAEGDGAYTVIADNLKTNSHTDSYTGDCSYKVTYSYGSLGITLSAVPTGSGVVAKKPVPVVTPTVKLIDFSKSGTLGIVILGGMAVVAMAAVYCVRVFVLRVDPAQPNRKKHE